MKRLMRGMMAVGAVVVGLFALSNYTPKADAQPVPVEMLSLAMLAGATVKVKDLTQNLWTKDGVLYRTGTTEMEESHAEELGLLDGDSPAQGGQHADDGGGGGGGSDIPDDFPGAKALRAAGWDMGDVMEATKEDLVALKGIGDATADEIIASRPEE